MADEVKTRDEVVPQHHDELEIGDQYNLGGRTVTQAESLAYVSLSGNIGENHLNKHAKQAEGDKERVFYGMGTAAIQNALANQIYISPGGGLYGYDRIRFTNPVYLGESIRLEVSIENLEDYDETRGMMTLEREVYNQDDELKMHAISKHLTQKQP